MAGKKKQKKATSNPSSFEVAQDTPPVEPSVTPNSGPAVESTIALEPSTAELTETLAECSISVQHQNPANTDLNMQRSPQSNAREDQSAHQSELSTGASASQSSEQVTHPSALPAELNEGHEGSTPCATKENNDTEIESRECGNSDEPDCDTLLQQERERALALETELESQSELIESRDDQIAQLREENAALKQTVEEQSMCVDGLLNEQQARQEEARLEEIQRNDMARGLPTDKDGLVKALGICQSNLKDAQNEIGLREKAIREYRNKGDDNGFGEIIEALERYRRESEELRHQNAELRSENRNLRLLPVGDHASQPPLQPTGQDAESRADVDQEQPDEQQEETRDSEEEGN